MLNVNPTHGLSDLTWEKALLPRNSTIEDAINNLNLSSLRLVLITDKDNNFLGTISDGDIRRGLLRGLDLKSSIENIANRNSFVVPPGLSQETVKQLMLANKLQQVPIVDSSQRILGLHVWHQFADAKEKRSNAIVIMAGGRGSRLMPHTSDAPKPMMSIGSKPILEHILSRAKNEGFYRFVISINYLGQIIKEYFGDGGAFGVEISYIEELNPLGTAGSLSLLSALPSLNEPFIVTNGDVLTDIRYGDVIDFHSFHLADATMAVQQYDWQNPYGVVHTKGIEIEFIEEKPVIRSHINAGIYALSPTIIQQVPKNTFLDMPTLFEKLKSNLYRTIAYPMHEPWIDIGQPSDLDKANAQYAAKNNL